MNRRVLAMVLTLCMVAALACGCTSGDKTNPDAATQSVSTDTTQAEASTPVENASKYPITKGKTTVTAMVTVSAGFNAEDKKKILWDELEKLTNIHVEFTTIEKEQLPIYLASGDWPDFFHDPLSSSDINSYGVEGKRFVNYNDYLQYMPNLVACMEKYPTVKKVVTSTDGAMYQPPKVIISATSASARAHYREDVFNELGLKVPTTTDEFHSVLTAIKKAKGIAPIVATMDKGGYEYFLFAPFGEATNPNFDSLDGKTVVYNRISEQYKRYLEYVSQLYSEGLIHKEYMTLSDATMNSMAQEGTSVFSNFPMGTVTEKDFKSGKVEIGTLAPLTSQYSSKQKIIGAPHDYMSGYAINKDSKYIKEICQMVDIAFAEKEVAEGTGLYGIAFTYGPENITWKYADKEKTSFSYILPEGTNLSPTSYTLKYVTWTSSSGWFDTMMVTAQEGNARARQLGYVKNEIPYQYKWFPTDEMPLTPEEQSVIDAKYTDINKYVTEMRGKFITGVEDVDAKWDEYVATVKQMGIEDVLKAYQAAYDRWNKL